jgi:hypothetical protein
MSPLDVDMEQYQRIAVDEHNITVAHNDDRK